MVVLVQNGCIRAKVAVFGKSGSLRAIRMYSGIRGSIPAKVVLFGQVCCNRETGSFWAKWLYSDKSVCIRTKVVVFGQSAGIRAKVIVFWQSWRIRKTWLCSGKSGCIRGKVVVFRQK